MAFCKEIDRSKSPCLHYKNPGQCLLSERRLCPEYILNKKPVLSYSYVLAYTRCRKYWYQNYILGTEPLGKSLPILYGQLFHANLAFLQSRNPDLEVEIKKISDKIYDVEIGNEVPQELKTLTGFLNAYKQLPISTFHDSEIEKENYVEYSDFILKTTTDLYEPIKKIIYDWKWIGQPDDYTFFTTKLQAGLYLLANPDAKAITYRLFRKPALKQTKKEKDFEFLTRIEKSVLNSPKHYIIDKTFWRSEYNFHEIKASLYAIAEEIKTNLLKGENYFYENYSGCFSPYTCLYLKQCESNLI
ncbi:MAG: PD-(D/E)XK nuclease family protein [Flavobacterium sp.]|nr:PD-(D/E)XK nuclease family protein [Flavobacterium sp.]